MPLVKGFSLQHASSLISTARRQISTYKRDPGSNATSSVNRAPTSNAIIGEVIETNIPFTRKKRAAESSQLESDIRRHGVQNQDDAESYTSGLLSSIYGLTAAVKDNFVTETFPTTCASNILQGFHGPTATVVRLLKQAGVDVVAKTNMDEFGMGSHSTHSAYGAVQNVIHRSGRLSAGGSSGGSAMAVATGLVDFALGSDTGGSVRLPAAYTQTIGFKPSYGRISRNGLVPYANSLDTVGIISRSCQDLEKIFEILDQVDPKDPTCLSSATRNRIVGASRKRSLFKVGRNEHGQLQHFTLPKAIRRCRIGVPVEYNIEEMHPLVRKSWIQCLSQLQSYGHEIVRISLPMTSSALPAYYIIAPAEASSNLAKYDGVRYGAPRDPNITDDEGGTLYAQYRGALFGDEVKRRILLGSYTLSAGAMDNYFIKAQKIRRLVQHDFNLVFRMPHPLLPETEVIPNGVDFIVCPTAPTPPPLLSEVHKADLLDTYTNDVFTVPASLAGLPAISIPPPRFVGELEGVDRIEAPTGPDRAVGMQMIAQYGDDIELIRFAGRQTALFHDGKIPKLRGPRVRIR